MATFTQNSFRFRNNDNGETNASWIANANTNITPTVGAPGLILRIRIAATQTGTAGTLTGRLYIAKNGGSYAQASASATTGCRVGTNTTYFADNDATTQQLSSGTFVAGKMDCATGQTTATASMATNAVTDHEYEIELVFADLANGDYFDFRERNSTTAFGTYTNTGRITVTKNTPPTTALNTPTDTATGQSLTPTLNFTGTDADGDTIEYEVQIDTVNTFDAH
jgi:hypothetical protein